MDEILSGMYKRLVERIPHYEKYRNYLAGAHPQSFASKTYDTTFGAMVKGLVDNRCPAIVAAVGDKLQLEGIESSDDAMASELDAWVNGTRFLKVANMACAKALEYGDSHIILTRLNNGDVIPHLQVPGSVFTWVNEETGQVAGAMKQWRGQDEYWRVTVWTPGYMTRYISKENSDIAPSEWVSFKPELQARIEGDRIPVFSFINQPNDFGVGQSLLKDVLPMQNGLNKAWSDMLVSMEFAAFRQRWVTGVDIAIDPATGKEVPPYVAGVERLLTISNPDARMGSFEATDLSQYDRVIDKFLSAMASTARVPVHAFAPGGSWPSGEAMMKAEEPLIARVKDCQEEWGDVIEELVEFALLWEGARISEDTVFTAKWLPYDNRDALAEANASKVTTEALLNKVELGASSRQALRELGYSEDDIDKMLEEKADEQARAAQTDYAVPKQPIQSTQPVDEEETL